MMSGFALTLAMLPVPTPQRAAAHLPRRSPALAPLIFMPHECSAAASQFDELRARLEAPLVQEPDVSPNAAAPGRRSWPH